MGNYKDKQVIVIPPLPEDHPYRTQKMRVSYAVYRVLAPHLKAEGIAPLDRLEVVVPDVDDEEEQE